MKLKMTKPCYDKYTGQLYGCYAFNEWREIQNASMKKNGLHTH